MILIRSRRYPDIVLQVVNVDDDGENITVERLDGRNFAFGQMGYHGWAHWTSRTAVVSRNTITHYARTETIPVDVPIDSLLSPVVDGRAS